jgi:putative ABC transport system permease protein
MELWVGAFNLGFLYAFMAMGVFITFRIYNFPDVTVDGSFTTGAAIVAVLLVEKVNPFLALVASFVVGGVAGCLTGFIHTRFNINGLLAGILVMTGLYSINLHLMGRSNIPLINQSHLLTFLESIQSGLPKEVWLCLCFFGVMILFWVVTSLFFKTDLGITMRTTGSNPTMASASGVHVKGITIFGIAIANGLVGVSGGLVAQYQGFADIGMGIGTVVFGLAAVIIGESVLRPQSIPMKILSVILGSVIFRLMIALALYVGLNPIDLKLITAAFVLLVLVAPHLLTEKGFRISGMAERIYRVMTARHLVIGGCIIAFLLAAGFIGYKALRSPLAPSSKMVRIGIFQVSDHPLLNITRDSFLEEMKRLGYESEKNCIFSLGNANGDLPTVSSILDKFIQDHVDIIVPISTACTQAAIHKVKDRPIVFATVANPFIIGAGRSDTDHLSNVTGIYGAAPMDKMVEVVTRILSGNIKVGTIWDSAQENSVFNVNQLKKVLSQYKNVTFVGTTITNSSEVYQAAVSLVTKGIDAFVLAPDNIVYSAFESVVKAAQTKKIPIFVSDVERLQDGALAVYGYDYTSSGIQAAHLVDRVLKGENPAQIPFGRYEKLTFGLNLDVAKEINITIPNDLLAKATKVYGLDRTEGAKKPRIGVIQFATDPLVERVKTGVIDALAQNGYFDGKNIDLIFGNAQADFSMIHSIIQDFLRKKVDIIVPLATPCLQSAMQLAGNRKDVVIVFTFVSNPYAIGAAKSPTDHPPNITGVSCLPPIEKLLDLIKEVFPDRKKVGVVWNSSEANSESNLRKLRPHASKIGLKVIEATVTSPAEVLEASRSLVAKGAQVFLNPADNTLCVSFDSFAKIAKENKIPVFSPDSIAIEDTFIVLGPDFYQTGYDGGSCLARVLKGEDPAHIPIHQTEKTPFMINMDVARRLGVRVDPGLLKRADRIVGMDQGTPPKRLVLFSFSNNIVLESSAKGVMDELRRSGILEKYRITVDEKNAQNDYAVANAIVQDIIRRKYDYIVTVSTAALQVTANANKTIPHIFGAVTDPFRAGVAKDSLNHPPHLTGIATFQPVEYTLRAMREIFPEAKRIGILWTPAEVNSEACIIKARSAAKACHFELLEQTVSSTGEVKDALTALLNKKIDLFFTSGDSTVTLALETVAEILKQYKIPYFTNSPSDVEQGAFFSVGADYYEVGVETAKLARRVIEGEDPKDIPIKEFIPEKIGINLSLAKFYRVTIPESYLKKAAVVKR